MDPLYTYLYMCTIPTITYVSLCVHSQGEGDGEGVEREDVTMQPSLPTERLVGWQVGTAEGQSQPSANTAPTHDVVCVCTYLHTFLHHIITCHSHPTHLLHVLYLMKTVVVETLYYCNLLCCVKCSTLLLICITL